ncbi:DNA glycosylase and apyrimidinic (AP) lyase [Candidatus Ishikawaella capsulata Mpkobe]|uniref:DNA glycosylase and apyrimidinic (AP) lyase n=1 Tax=Candidatus Ishikawaella capsulata Mpkobe TaxID=476281 RepID=C5WD82_9ENTR|nr:DNA glycosylase and apyrimidinic (AP) lyase [Candidatus Ishikawaella capsulata Mpkobe]
MINLGIQGITDYIQPLGLFNNKAKNIVQTSQILLQKYRGKVPASLTALKSLPGVGQKTANVVLNIAFGQTTIAVDTHVFRVCNRTGFVESNTIEQTEKKLLKVTPEKFKINCHNWLMLHGRYICIARKPKCSSCLIEDLCEYNNKFK